MSLVEWEAYWLNQKAFTVLSRKPFSSTSLNTPLLPPIHFSVPFSRPTFRCQSHNTLLKGGSCKPWFPSAHCCVWVRVCKSVCVCTCLCWRVWITHRLDAFGPTNGSNQQAITAHTVSLWERLSVSERERERGSVERRERKEQEEKDVEWKRRYFIGISFQKMKNYWRKKKSHFSILLSSTAGTCKT